MPSYKINSENLERSTIGGFFEWFYIEGPDLYSADSQDTTLAFFMALRTYMLEIDFRTLGLINLGEIRDINLSYLKTWKSITIPLPFKPTEKLPAMIIDKPKHCQLRTSHVKLKNKDNINLHDHAIILGTVPLQNPLVINLYPIPVINNYKLAHLCPPEWKLPDQTKVSGYSSHILDGTNYNGRSFTRVAVIKAGQNEKDFPHLDEDVLVLSGTYQGELSLNQAMRYCRDYLISEMNYMIGALDHEKKKDTLRCPALALNRVACQIGRAIYKTILFMVHPNDGIIYTGVELTPQEKAHFKKVFKDLIETAGMDSRRTLIQTFIHYTDLLDIFKILNKNGPELGSLQIDFSKPRRISFSNYVNIYTNEDCKKVKILDWRFCHPDSKNMRCGVTFGMSFKEFKDHIKLFLESINRNYVIEMTSYESDPTALYFSTEYKKHSRQTVFYDDYCRIGGIDIGTYEFSAIIKESGDEHIIKISQNKFDQTIFTFQDSKMIIMLSQVNKYHIIETMTNPTIVCLRMDKVALDFFFKPFSVSKYVDMSLELKITDKFVILEINNTNQEDTGTYDFSYRYLYPRYLVTVTITDEKK